MTLFMKVTRDRYELPLAVARTQAELARIVGVDESAVSKGLRNENSAYKKVEVDDEDQA